VVVFLLEVIGNLGRIANDAGEFHLAMLGDVPAAAYGLLAASSIALLWRRSRPLRVLAVTMTAYLVWDVMGLAGSASLALLISLYGVGRYVEEDRASRAAVVAAVFLAVIHDVIDGEPPSVIGVSLALVLAAWYVGRRLRARRDYLALLEERTEYLERERVAEARRAVAEERTRIARELHDVVAHRVSMMTVQAGAAQTVAAADPERAMRAMEAVEAAGRDALSELRQVLGVLRAGGQSEDPVPVHGLADIPGLVAEMRGAGMDVTLSDGGAPDQVPARVDLASYRIVQEALTNALKHAGPDPAVEVRLATEDGMLVVEVADRGSGVSVLPGSGHGLAGMRERANLLGGTFEAGHRPGGGFRIMAHLPFEESPT
jgi:signal transduction histidine kinase